MAFWNKKTPVEDFSGRVRHIAFIMDGNGRWAKRRSLPRKAGHARGAETFRRVIQYCHRLGIRTVTVYAFSTENWSRPQDEVAAIMQLLDRFMEEELQDADTRDMRVVFLGDKAALTPAQRERAEEIERRTRDKSYCLNIALNYGGRDELVHAANTLLAQGKGSVTAADISGALYTAHSPDPDLIIRTGGDYRISNFLLWQSAYAEYYFTKTLWPDLSEREIYRALKDFCSRHRRFGGLDPEDMKEKE